MRLRAFGAAGSPTVALWPANEYQFGDACVSGIDGAKPLGTPKGLERLRRVYVLLASPTCFERAYADASNTRDGFVWYASLSCSATR